MNNFAEIPGLDAYIETASWSSTTDDGQPLDETDHTLSDTARVKLAEYLATFWQMVDEDEELCGHEELVNGQTEHDLWLTQNNHGAGFWDGDYPKTGAKICEIARVVGEITLYVSDGALIEVY